MSNAVLLEVQNQVAVVTLNQPKSLNALSNDIVEGLNQALSQIKKDADIKAVILTGSGRAFCAGGNIKGFPAATNANVGREYMEGVASFIRPLANLEKPVIAAVNGYAVGAGFSIAVACDFIIAEEDAKFSMSFNKVGLVPDLGSLYHLPRIVGMARAKELAYSNRTLSASEAKEYGLCLEVVPSGDVLNRALAIAETFVNGSPIATALTKTVLNHSYESTLDQILREECTVQGIAFTTEDHQVAARAFKEKSK